MAHNSIEPSKEWQSVIETALRTCDGMAVFLHPGFHASNWCDQEVGFALARRVPLLPIALGEMPYGFMSKFQAIKATGQRAPQLGQRVVEWLATTPTAQQAMTEGLVTALPDSGSYAQTRRLMKLLGNMPRFTPDQLDRLAGASKDNAQVEDANAGGIMVPDLIQRLIARHGGTTTPQLAAEPPF